MPERYRILGDGGSRLRLIWWPWLIGPGAIAALAGVGAAGTLWEPAKWVTGDAVQHCLDQAGPAILAVALAVYLVKAVVTRNPLLFVMVGLTASLLCREIHFEWAHHGIYLLLAGVGVWALIWRKRLARPARDVRHTSWVIATLWTYFLAFLLYRQAFKFVPGERAVHNFLEEGVETVSHLMLVVAGLLASRRKYRRPSGGRRDEPAPEHGPPGE